MTSLTLCTLSSWGGFSELIPRCCRQKRLCRCLTAGMLPSFQLFTVWSPPKSMTFSQKVREKSWDFLVYANFTWKCSEERWVISRYWQGCQILVQIFCMEKNSHMVIYHQLPSDLWLSLVVKKKQNEGWYFSLLFIYLKELKWIQTNLGWLADKVSCCQSWWPNFDFHIVEGVFFWLPCICCGTHTHTEYIYTYVIWLYTPGYKNIIHKSKGRKDLQCYKGVLDPFSWYYSATEWNELLIHYISWKNFKSTVK